MRTYHFAHIGDGEATVIDHATGKELGSVRRTSIATRRLHTTGGWNSDLTRTQVEQITTRMAWKALDPWGRHLCTQPTRRAAAEHLAERA